MEESGPGDAVHRETVTRLIANQRLLSGRAKDAVGIETPTSPAGFARARRVRLSIDRTTVSPLAWSVRRGRA